MLQTASLFFGLGVWTDKTCRWNDQILCVYSYGPHYWVVDVEMDCGKTENGLFEIKAVVNGQWEGDIDQVQPCTGIGAVPPPYKSGNHFARCGYFNVFHFGGKACEINNIWLKLKIWQLVVLSLLDCNDCNFGFIFVLIASGFPYHRNSRSHTYHL